MKFNIEKSGDVMVVTLKSNLEGGPDTYKLRDEVKAKLGDDERRFLINMKDAGFVNSTGIGVVVSILSSVKSAGGMLKICGVTERARRAFVTTGVWQLFDSYESQEEALAAFESA